MNPFLNPPKIMIKTAPQDMRAGIQRLCSIIESELASPADDGTLWCFISRDKRKAKMLRYESGAWCLWYVRLPQGHLRTSKGASGAAALPLTRSELICLLATTPPAEHINRLS